MVRCACLRHVRTCQRYPDSIGERCYLHHALGLGGAVSCTTLRAFRCQEFVLQRILVPCLTNDSMCLLATGSTHTRLMPRVCFGSYQIHAA